jgi:hypothetical protein
MDLFQSGLLPCRKMVIINRFPLGEINDLVTNQQVYIDGSPFYRSFMAEVNRESMTFEGLHRLLVFLRRRPCLERAEISALPGFRIFLARIEPILARFQFPDHEPIEYSRTNWTPRVIVGQPLRLPN